MHRDAIQKRSSLIDSALGLQSGAWHKHPIWRDPLIISIASWCFLWCTLSWGIGSPFTHFLPREVGDIFFEEFTLVLMIYCIAQRHHDPMLTSLAKLLCSNAQRQHLSSHQHSIDLVTNMLQAWSPTCCQLTSYWDPNRQHVYLPFADPIHTLYLRITDLITNTRTHLCMHRHGARP